MANSRRDMRAEGGAQHYVEDVPGFKLQDQDWRDVCMQHTTSTVFLAFISFCTLRNGLIDCIFIFRVLLGITI